MTGEMVSHFAHRIQAVVFSEHNLNRGLRVSTQARTLLARATM